jgi:glutamyl-queuosine tRNA(Asp) synthetase
VRFWENNDGEPANPASRTRFAPSPTGDLHLGGALCALASRAVARQGGAAFVLRVEDLDPPRVVAGSAERILDDLRWLGLPWDEGPVFQSARTGLYERAVESLTRQGLTYPCDCSRAEIARVASAPHEGEEVVYPGTCRGKDPTRSMRRPPAIRLRLPDERVVFEDGCQGRFEQRLSDVGDFVLRRADGVFAYQLAVAVDDLAMRIGCVVRGVDLLASTPRQLHLMRLLGARDAELPRYVHLPLARGQDGERLSKRTPGGRVRALRDAGIDARAIVEVLSRALGLRADGAPPQEWPREGLVVPAAWSGVGV